MIETLLGGLLGGAFRLAPELLKWLDRKGERGHELAMQDKALEFEKLRGAQRMEEIGAGAEAAWNVGAIETLREAGEITSVCVVFENMANPCVAALVDYLGRTGMPYRLQSGSFAEDAAVIFGARRLVLGVGTFGPGVAATSDRLREVYAFRQKGFRTLPRLERVWLVEAGADYIPRDGWTGSDAQRAMMLSYPDDQLELVKLV